MAHRKEHPCVQGRRLADQLVRRRLLGVAGAADRAGLKSSRRAHALCHLDDRLDKASMTDPGRRRAVVDAVKEGVRLTSRPARPSLPTEDLINIGLVALRIGEGETTDKALRRLHVLELDRHLVEVAEEELIARDQIWVFVVVDVLTPALRLLEGHPRGDAIDPDRPAELGAGVDQRLDPGDQPISVLAFRGDHGPPLGGDIVAGSAEIVERETARLLRLALPLITCGVVGEAPVEHRRMLVGVGQKEVKIGVVVAHALAPVAAPTRGPVLVARSTNSEPQRDEPVFAHLGGHRLRAQTTDRVGTLSADARTHQRPTTTSAA